MAIIFDQEIDKGDTLRVDIDFGDVDEDGVETTEDMTGATALGSVRFDPDEDGELLDDFSFVSSGPELLVGAIRMYISDGDTEDWIPGIYFYSVRVVHPDGDNITHVKGKVLVNPRITV